MADARSSGSYEGFLRSSARIVSRSLEEATAATGEAQTAPPAEQYLLDGFVDLLVCVGVGLLFCVGSYIWQRFATEYCEEKLPTVKVIEHYKPDPKDTEKAQCTICLEEIEAGAKCAQPEVCKHLYHYECLLEWAKVNSICPQCREPLNWKAAAPPPNYANPSVLGAVLTVEVENENINNENNEINNAEQPNEAWGASTAEGTAGDTNVIYSSEDNLQSVAANGSAGGASMTRSFNEEGQDEEDGDRTIPNSPVEDVVVDVENLSGNRSPENQNRRTSNIELKNPDRHDASFDELPGSVPQSEGGDENEGGGLVFGSSNQHFRPEARIEDNSNRHNDHPSSSSASTGNPIVQSKTDGNKKVIVSIAELCGNVNNGTHGKEVTSHQSTKEDDLVKVSPLENANEDEGRVDVGGLPAIEVSSGTDDGIASSQDLDVTHEKKASSSANDYVATSL